jgi:hypothetical protein
MRTTLPDGPVKKIYQPPINADERRWKTARRRLSVFIGVYRRLSAADFFDWG